jgi:hypothetical protein
MPSQISIYCKEGTDRSPFDDEIVKSNIDWYMTIANALYCRLNLETWVPTHDHYGLEAGAQSIQCSKVWCWPMHGRACVVQLFVRWHENCSFGCKAPDARQVMLQQRGLYLYWWTPLWFKLSCINNQQLFTFVYTSSLHKKELQTPLGFARCPSRHRSGVVGDWCVFNFQIILYMTCQNESTKAVGQVIWQLSFFLFLWCIILIVYAPGYLYSAEKTYIFIYLYLWNGGM